MDHANNLKKRIAFLKEFQLPTNKTELASLSTILSFKDWKAKEIDRLEKEFKEL